MSLSLSGCRLHTAYGIEPALVAALFSLSLGRDTSQFIWLAIHVGHTCSEIEIPHNRQGGAQNDWFIAVLDAEGDCAHSIWW